MNKGLATGRRELAAVVFIDLVGYTALTQQSEVHALALLDEFRAQVRGALAHHSGREVKTVGDAHLLHFGSAVDAVRFAIRGQRALAQRNARLPKAWPMQARVGIHAGEVVLADNDIFGDVVNVASRVQHECVPGGICVTRAVYDQVRNHWDIPVSRLRNVSLKNVIDPVELYKIDPYGKRLAPPKPVALGAGTVAALGLLGVSVFGGRLHLPREAKPQAVVEAPAEKAAEPSPTPSPPPSPEPAAVAPVSAPDAEPAEAPMGSRREMIITRTRDFARKYGMPREVRESAGALMHADFADRPRLAREHLALLERLSADLDREGVSTETMPKLMEATQRKVHERMEAGKLDPRAIEPLMHRLEAALKDGDLRAGNQIRKEIEAQLAD